METVAKVLDGPRGLRNNNPGNIRESPFDKTQWIGERATDDDKAFEEFETPEYGIRALAVILKNYRLKHGLTSIRGIITRWAPPSENNTTAYINVVAAAVGKHPDVALDFSHDLQPLITAIIRHENGKQPYSAETIAKGISLA